MRTTIGLVSLWMVAGCVDREGASYEAIETSGYAPSTTGGGTTQMVEEESSSSTTGGPSEDGTTNGGTTGSGSTTGSSTGGPVDCTAHGEGIDQNPPTDEEVLLAWLEAGRYLSWAGDAVSRDGEHHEDPRIFINDAAAAGLEAGSDAMPVGAAAVIEYYYAEELIGWGVQRRLNDALSAQGWFWYEWIEGEVTMTSKHSPQCAGCHGNLGADLMFPACPLLDEDGQRQPDTSG